MNRKTKDKITSIIAYLIIAILMLGAVLLTELAVYVVQLIALCNPILTAFTCWIGFLICIAKLLKYYSEGGI